MRLQKSAGVRVACAEHCRNGHHRKELSCFSKTRINSHLTFELGALLMCAQVAQTDTALVPVGPPGGTRSTMASSGVGGARSGATPPPSAMAGTVRRLSGQHLPPPRGVPLVGTAPPASSIPRGPAGPPSSGRARSGPPPREDNVSLMVRAPTLRTKAAEEWYKSSEQGAKATAEPAAPRVAREVDSKSDVKGTPGGAAGLGAARPPVYAMPSQGQAQQAAPHLIAHGAGRFVIRRLDPSAPLPPRPKGPPPAHLVAARPMMMARPPYGYGSQSAYQQPQMPPPITFQDQKQVSGYERADGAGDGMDDSSSWAGGAEGKDDYFRDRPPSIWSEYWDEEVDASYYYNKLTGEATWIKPADFDGEADYFVSPEDGSSTIDLSGVGGENSVEG